jgi:hypothetical protein
MITYGATVTRLQTPDLNGHLTDVAVVFNSDKFVLQMKTGALSARLARGPAGTKILANLGFFVMPSRFDFRVTVTSLAFEVGFATV